MGSFILALDQGTTSSRAILFDRSGRVAAMAQQTFPQHYPQPGWVEHDPLELWESQRSVAAQALRKLGPDARIAGIGITNQRETTFPARGSAPSAASCSSARWKRGSSGVSPAGPPM